MFLLCILLVLLLLVKVQFVKIHLLEISLRIVLQQRRLRIRLVFVLLLHNLIELDFLLHHQYLGMEL